MALKIIPETDIYLTEEDARRYRMAYNHFCRFHAPPPSFEEFIRSNPFAKRTYAEARAEVARLANRINTDKYR